MTFIPREESFICEYCTSAVEPLQKGTYRNHCPKCLYSKHVDRDGPGDRLSACKGLLKPTGLDQDAKKGFVLLYLCVKCGQTSRNRAAPDDDLISFTQNIHKNV